VIIKYPILLNIGVKRRMKRFERLQTVTVDKSKLPTKVVALLDDEHWVKEHKDLHRNMDASKVWLCLLPFCPFRPSYGGATSAVSNALKELTENWRLKMQTRVIPRCIHCKKLLAEQDKEFAKALVIELEALGD